MASLLRLYPWARRAGSLLPSVFGRLVYQCCTSRALQFQGRDVYKGGWGIRVGENKRHLSLEFKV